MKLASITGLFLLVSGSALAFGAAEEPAEPDPLDRFIRTGHVESCVRISGIDRIKPLDETRFLVETRHDYYLSIMNGTCRNAASPGTRIQYETIGSRLCANDLVDIVHNADGQLAGACAMGGFELLQEKPVTEE